ncbi:MAG: hypothetical protein LBQ39_03685 [Tannerellaceae bacterium]|jgi:uncharacterized integral membrane protein|nr:hypothetical protein [Tannerellaceae bacterium]
MKKAKKLTKNQKRWTVIIGSIIILGIIAVWIVNSFGVTDGQIEGKCC